MRAMSIDTSDPGPYQQDPDYNPANDQPEGQIPERDGKPDDEQDEL